MYISSMLLDGNADVVKPDGTDSDIVHSCITMKPILFQFLTGIIVHWLSVYPFHGTVVVGSL